MSPFRSGMGVLSSFLVGTRTMQRSIGIEGPGTDMAGVSTFSELFAQQQTSQINVDGPLYSLYELPPDFTEVTVRFVSGKSQPPQGLRLKVRGGSMTVDSTVCEDLVLWRDTAPDEVQIRFAWNSRGRRSVRVWNAWRVRGVTQAWLGNAGMRVTVIEGGVFELSCSDGEGAPNFGDLVARVEGR